MTVIYITISNSDNKLTQAEWAEYWREMCTVVDRAADFSGSRVHGVWVSPSTFPYQKACWCVDLPGDDVAPLLKATLRGVAREYRQESIAWAEAPVTEFIRAG